MAMQSLDQENPPYISGVREFAGDGFKSVLWISDLADAKEIGRRWLYRLFCVRRLRARFQGVLCALVSTAGLSGPVKR